MRPRRRCVASAPAPCSTTSSASAILPPRRSRGPPTVARTAFLHPRSSAGAGDRSRHRRRPATAGQDRKLPTHRRAVAAVWRRAAQFQAFTNADWRSACRLDRGVLRRCFAAHLEQRFENAGPAGSPGHHPALPDFGDDGTPPPPGIPRREIVARHEQIGAPVNLPAASADASAIDSSPIADARHEIAPTRSIPLRGRARAFRASTRIGSRPRWRSNSASNTRRLHRRTRNSRDRHVIPSKCPAVHDQRQAVCFVAEARAHPDNGAITWFESVACAAIGRRVEARACL